MSNSPRKDAEGVWRCTDEQGFVDACYAVADMVHSLLHTAGTAVYPGLDRGDDYDGSPLVRGGVAGIIAFAMCVEIPCAALAMELRKACDDLVPQVEMEQEARRRGGSQRGSA